MEQRKAPYKYKESANNALHSAPIDLVETSPGMYAPVPVTQHEVQAYNEYRERRDRKPEYAVPVRDFNREYRARFIATALLNAGMWIAVLVTAGYAGYALIVFITGAFAGVYAVAMAAGKYIGYAVGAVAGFGFLSLLISGIFGRERKETSAGGTTQGVSINQTVIVQQQTK